MTTEADFLRALQDAPGDDDVRGVYADWLEERADPRAELLRAEVRLAHLAPGHADFDAVRSRVHDLSRTLDRAWVAAVSRARIEGCDLPFVFRCPRQWEQLTPTDDPTVRSCDICRKS